MPAFLLSTVDDPTEDVDLVDLSVPAAPLASAVPFQPAEAAPKRKLDTTTPPMKSSS